MEVEKVSLTPAWQGLECQVHGLDCFLRQWEPQRVLSRGRAWKGAMGQLGAVAAAQRRDSHCCSGSGWAHGLERREAEVTGGWQAEQAGHTHLYQVPQAANPLPAAGSHR